MKRISSLLLITVLIVSFAACTSGPVDNEENESNVTTNVADGATDVSINSAFTMTFSASVNSASVTSSTFFVVPVTAGANISVEETLFKSAIDTAICNPANAITGTITASDAGTCATIFTLAPDASLNYGTDYALCATTGITLCDPNRYGFFAGFMKTFTTAYTVGGTLSGLSGTVVLQNNAADDLTLTADGTFVFPETLADGAVYAVTVKTQPSGQVCTVANGTGTISGANVSNVTVTCLNTYTIGGAVEWLSGTVVLQNNGGDDLSITANGNFTFTTPIADGTAYEITVLTQPAMQTCTVSNGTGTVSRANVTNVSVACVYTRKIIFISEATGTDRGNLGGVSGADSKCMSDSGRPDAGTYKAMIVDGTNRVACTTSNCGGGEGEHTDWVLDPSTAYYRSDVTTKIGTTNGNGIFTFPLDNSFLTDDDELWTGLASDWTTGSKCENWTSNNGTKIGEVGLAARTNSQSIYVYDQWCDRENVSLICVAQ